MYEPRGYMSIVNDLMRITVKYTELRAAYEQLVVLLNQYMQVCSLMQEELNRLHSENSQYEPRPNISNRPN